MPGRIEHRYRYPNGRILTLVQEGEGHACPVCGCLYSCPLLQAAGEPDDKGIIQLSSDNALADFEYGSCFSCGATFYNEDEPVARRIIDGANDMPVWRERRREYLHKFGRTPDVFVGLSRIGVEPDYRHVSPPDNVPTLAMSLLKGPSDTLDMLPAQADLDTQDWDGWTALLWMVALQQAGVVDRLLTIGADANRGNQRGETPLMWAAWMGGETIVERLCGAAANVHSRTSRERQDPSDLRIDRLIPFRRAPGETALHWAAERGHAHVVELLLRRGSIAEVSDDAGYTPLMVAANAATACALIAAGGKPNTRDKRGFTAVVYAALAGRRDVLRVLADAGGDVNVAARAKDGFETPLEAAIERNDHATVRLLLSLGADPDLKSPGGGRPLHHAAHVSDAAMLRLLLDAGADVNGRGNRGSTPLISALCWLHAKIENVQLLLDAGADPNLMNVPKESPLHHACKGSRGQAAVPVLIAAGADVNAQDKNGDTPLHQAVSGSFFNNVRTLLAAGADPDRPNARSVTPRGLASKSRDP